MKAKDVKTKSRKMKRGGYRPRGYKSTMANVSRPRFNSSMVVEIAREGFSSQSTWNAKVLRMRHTASRRFLRGWIRRMDKTGFLEASESDLVNWEDFNNNRLKDA